MVRLRAEVADDWKAFVGRIDELRGLELKAGSASAAVMAQTAMAIHHAYGAIESALARVRRAIEGEDPSGQRWHEDLLSSMTLDLGPVRPAILSAESAALLRTLLGFRHFFRHAYSVPLNPVRLEELRQVALQTLPPLESDFRRLDALIEALAAA